MSPQNLIEENLSLLKTIRDPDARQEAFFGLRDAAIKFNKSKSPENNFIAFARQHIRWRIADYYRNNSFTKRSRNPQTQLYYVDELEVLDKDELISHHKHFKELVDTLPLSQNDKEFLHLYFEKDFTFQQVGEYFSITESGAYCRFRKIVKILRQSKLQKLIERK